MYANAMFSIGSIQDYFASVCGLVLELYTQNRMIQNIYTKRIYVYFILIISKHGKQLPRLRKRSCRIVLKQNRLNIIEILIIKPDSGTDVSAGTAEYAIYRKKNKQALSRW